MRFWVVFRSERAVSTIFPPYIMPNGTYERIKFFSDTLPLSSANTDNKEVNHLQTTLKEVFPTSTITSTFENDISWWVTDPLLSSA